jgi:acylphosphatase
MKARAHLIIKGRVQGVGFRWFVYDVASSFRLAGWVKNLYDGRVEAVFEGERAAIEEAIKMCADGPRSAAVSGIDSNWDEEPENLAGFDIRH